MFVLKAAFLFLSFCYGALTCDAVGDVQQFMLFMGTKGVGKSTVVNSLLGKRVAKTGIDPNGVTKLVQSYEHDGIVYIDTPAIMSAQEIGQSLLMDGHYSLFFVITLEAGRIKPEDSQAIDMVMASIKTDNRVFNVIVNKVTKNEIRNIFNVNHEFESLYRHINSGSYKTDNIFYIERNRDIEDELTELASIDESIRTSIYKKNYSFFLPDRLKKSTHDNIELTDKIRNIFAFIKNNQIVQTERNVGAWPAWVSARTIKTEKIHDANFFMTLQISLSLARTEKRFHLRGLDEINERIVALSEQYLNDTTRSERKQGSVCFWPYVTISKEKSLHSLSPESNVLTIFDDFDLPNDLDTSSRLAIFYMNNNRNHPFIKNFIEVSSHTVNHENGAYATWVKNYSDPSSSDKADCVVNLNVLAALAQYEKVDKLPPDSQKTMIRSCSFIKDITTNNTLLTNSDYYDRPSELFLSYAVALKAGVTGLLKDLSTMRELIHKEAELASLDQASSPTEIAEFILSMHYLAVVANNNSLNSALLHSLFKRLLDSIWDKNRVFTTPTSSVYIGRFKKDIFDWHSEAYSAALIIEALTIFIEPGGS